ncbi:hypothetical protein [Tropicimonas sp. S265A]|uniref:hypothetical protein n=1 Tax=Tropicimonas sp. S265A TaxID=3415134 RepID=UPI003C7B2D68
MRLPYPLTDMSAAARTVALVIAIGAAVCAQSLRAETAQLSAAEIEAHLVGQEIEVRRSELRATAKLELTGVARAQGDGWAATGHWLIFDDRLCFYMLGGPVQENNCAAIEKIAPGVFWSEDGTLLDLGGQ